MLRVLQLHPRPGDQRDRRAVHRHVLLRSALAIAAAVAVAAVAGCGKGGGGDHRLVAAIGDSITAGNPGYDPNPELRQGLGLGNDPDSQWEPAAGCTRQLARLVRAAKDENLDVAVADVLPYGPEPQADRVIDELNRRIAAMGRSSGATVLPFHRVLEDPEHPGQMKPEWTADGIRPSVEGYRRLGELAFQPPD